ncbi:MAG TPA: A/G-specific adenine glycosylase [Anaerolineales bacterium]|nr:A/G-specific adenine glycosylase [Anaerolineales bacterium]
MVVNFQTRLLEWYTQNARRLPWRGNPDPYAVWVSEIMLQQTRVGTALPYFERWMARFPTIRALALASQQEVLAAWEGLGYYSRARNLHRSAQIVMEQHGGELPGDLRALRRLCGIGRYTAAAIASLAFHQDEATLDGNIRRVLARVFDVAAPARSLQGEGQLWELAARHLPAGRAADYNQALMDLGATICKPRDPECQRCPLSGLCAANRLGIQNQRPVLAPKPEVPHYVVTAAVIRRNGQVLIAQRPTDGLLGGLWEFPGGKVHPGEDLLSSLKREIREELGVEVAVQGALGNYRHAYTHFRVSLHAFCCTLETGEPHNLAHTDLRWARPAQLADYPMGKIDRQIASQLFDSCWS